MIYLKTAFSLLVVAAWIWLAVYLWRAEMEIFSALIALSFVPGAWMIWRGLREGGQRAPGKERAP